MGNKSAVVTLRELREKKQKLEKTLAGEEARKDSLKKSIKSNMAKLAKYDITDVKDVPTKLKALSGQAEDLLMEINSRIPKEFKESDE